MKILVNNAQEQNMMESFLEALHEFGLYEVQAKDWDEAGIDGYVTHDEYAFLENAIFAADVVINSTIPPMTVESNGIQGVCSKCGTETCGTIDGDDLTFEDYQSLVSKDAAEGWLCETCWYKGDDE